MASVIPITLVGNNLGIRHKQINSLVQETYDRNEDFKEIQNVPEKSALDRIFKIDLASKHRDVQFIIANLKDRDMLYVSRALKAKWLLEPQYQDIFNPKNMEKELYPYMVTTAVLKMKKWVHLNLKEVHRIEDFYEYYADKDFKLAVKFLFKSSQEYILNEFPKIINKVTPRYFKVFCEVCPEVAKIFFDSLEINDELKSQYIYSQEKYYDSIKYLLKSDTQMCLDFTEKYFNVYRLERFSSSATKFVMTHHKQRFLNKPELYTAWILNLQKVAETLNIQECKEIVVKLARSLFLRKWFNFENVKPFFKRLKSKERVAFKNKVFIQHDVGDTVKEWPYKPPSEPEIEFIGPDLFEDLRHEPWEYERLSTDITNKVMKKCVHEKYALEHNCRKVISPKKCETLSDFLFYEYYFVDFERTFNELKKRILSESCPKNRKSILRFLIHKTGGCAENIASLMELLVCYSNESPNIRAAIIRRLAKIAYIWRLPDETWKQFLEFGQILGLDGKPSEVACIDGLHCVVIRSLVQNGTCDSNVFEAFLSNFSDFSHYILSSAEHDCIRDNLPRMLFSAATEKHTVKEAIKVIDYLLIVLKKYDIDVESFPGLISKIVELAEKDYSASKNLLVRLFNANIGQKALFRFTHNFFSYTSMNALKHDISIIDFEVLYESCMNSNLFKQFFRKIQIYFSEEGGLAMNYRDQLKEKEHNKRAGRLLAILLGDELQIYLHELDTSVNKNTKALAARIRANAHMARPGLDIETFGWSKAGAKLIANKLLTCPSIEVDSNIQKLMQSKRTARLASVLAKRTSYEADTIISIFKMRPTIGLKLGMKYICNKGENFMNVWKTIKPYIQEFDFGNDSNTKKYIRETLTNVDAVRIEIRPEYCTIIFKGFKRLESIQRYAPMPYLCCIEHLLPDINKNFIEELLSDFLKKEFIPEKLSDNDNDNVCYCMFLRILLKYIYFSKTEEIQTQRFETYMSPLLEKMTAVFNNKDTNKLFFKFLNELLLNLKNTTVFISTDYVSCLTVMKNIVKWLKIFLPIEKHFDKYVQIHLTMLYYKAIKQTVKQTPEVFEDDIKRYKIGVKLVGFFFGRYIARGVKDLMENYFESVIELYKVSMLRYLIDYYEVKNSTDFFKSIIRGIIDESKGDEVRLGMYILKDNIYGITDDASVELSNNLMEVKNNQLRYFLFSEIYLLVRAYYGFTRRP